jgi:hypothetical protein
VSPAAAPEDAPHDAARRAARLLRWYPRAWRERYGAEFAELLISDISERPRSRVRTLDVARGGVVARLAAAGLTGFRSPGTMAAPGGAATANVRASLGALGCCVAVFLVVGAAQWSQLTIGWQWSRTPGTPVALATVVTSAAMLTLLGLAVLAALAAFPAAELAWMAVSPVALAAMAIAAATLVRRAELPPRLLAFETRLATVTCAVMAVFLAGCGCWVATGAQRSLFHAGVVDVAGVAVMALTLGLARQASHAAARRLRPAGG